MWSKDNKSIFYVTKDDLDRPHKAGLPSSTLCSGTRCSGAPLWQHHTCFMGSSWAALGGDNAHSPWNRSASSTFARMPAALTIFHQWHISCKLNT